MALIIEDGTIVADANSFIDLAYARAFAEARGVTLSADDVILEVSVIKAMDYIIEFEPNLKGDRLGTVQELMYPRENVLYFGEYLDDGVMPKELLNAQAQAVMDIAAGTDPTPNGTTGHVIKNKVGPIEQEFSDKGSPSVKPILRKVEVMLAPLLKNTAGGGITTRRV
ncbi:MAG: hypothetical protein CMI54_06315 [Parcubacteria group bacterium]|jgi:hypothetical protein|nr:hypothetical protein [Parcubacteria group bacterium]|tara:strand:- start:5430 stop:5933 length:504 start_codon:yes stop_codon:yes gene_type:complete